MTGVSGQPINANAVWHGLKRSLLYRLENQAVSQGYEVSRVAIPPHPFGCDVRQTAINCASSTAV